jgi:glycosyltransferase involved in cell wall biosynthesis
MPGSSDRPAVSIILPTYNRAKFLPQAFESIRSQTFTNWELIVVDDGSTDNTRELVEDLTRGWAQSVGYHRQENQGAYGARNTGLDLATGRYVAFFDSDDVWLPHHLANCAAALDANPDLDWVYGSSRVADLSSGRVVEADVFRPGGRPRPFLGLAVEERGPLRVIRDDRVLECMLQSGLYCGLQCSVIRREVFAGYRFEAVSRNEAEDQLIVVEVLAAGRRLGYLDAVHLVYHIHAQNSSAAGGTTPEKHVRLFRALVAGYEGVRDRVSLSPAQTRALNRRLSGHYFWNLGYVLLGQPSGRAEGLGYMRRAIRLWPTNPWYWKSYCLAQLRGRRGATSPRGY